MFREHLDFIWRQVKRLGLSDAEAEDVAQRAFIVASKKLDQIEPTLERAFLFRTSTHLALNLRRGRERRREDYVEHDLPDPRLSAEELLDKARAREIADKVLDEMHVELRIVFVLFELEEMPISEIATLLAIPSGTVASRLRRARQQFHRVARRFVRLGDAWRGGAP
jgi:RNA polymerase sigma-70 factor (ECF subfamily)